LFLPHSGIQFANETAPSPVPLFHAVRFRQTATDMASDPHHQLLLENPQVRVFAVNLRPNEQSFVSHEHNFLTVTLQDCEIVMWPEGRSDIQSFRLGEGDVRFLFGGRARGLRNERNTTYRSITVEFLNPKVTTYSYQRDSGAWELW
jgi:hypothetical protein